MVLLAAALGSGQVVRPAAAIANAEATG